jgi:hypothetical protein
VSDIMHMHDNDAFAGREPVAKRIFRVQKHPIGIHERWSGDGHDKLYKIGFPIWAMVDDATGKWLEAWVVPSNRMGEIVAYLFLCLVEKFEGELWTCFFSTNTHTFCCCQVCPSSLQRTVAPRQQNYLVWPMLFGT